MNDEFGILFDHLLLENGAEASDGAEDEPYSGRTKTEDSESEDEGKEDHGYDDEITGVWVSPVVIRDSTYCLGTTR